MKKVYEGIAIYSNDVGIGGFVEWASVDLGNGEELNCADLVDMFNESLRDGWQRERIRVRITIEEVE